MIEKRNPYPTIRVNQKLLEFTIDPKFYIISTIRYTWSLSVIISDGIIQGGMTKGKGRKLQPTQVASPSKRGRKSNQQTLKNIANIYEIGIPKHI